MTAKEKASDLIVQFMKPLPVSADVRQRPTIAKHCVIICVDEMIEIQNDFYGLVLTESFRDRVRQRVEYLEQVKKELELL